jgi:hypothetical protein
MGCSVRTDRFRYTEWREWRSGEAVGRELYDHEADPRETINRAADPGFAQDVARSAALLERYRPAVGIRSNAAASSQAASSEAVRDLR